MYYIKVLLHYLNIGGLCHKPVASITRFKEVKMRLFLIGSITKSSLEIPGIHP